MSTYDDALIEKAAAVIYDELALREPDTKDIARAVLDAVADDLRAEGWDEGKHSEHTPACRLGDIPDECTCPNPYRRERA